MALSACEVGPVPQSPRPIDRPNGVAPPSITEPAGPAAPSGASRALSTYYARVQNELLSQGLLRSDGGGPDTPFYASDLVRNFEKIAFYDEYARGGGLQRSDGSAGRLKKWTGPVRFSTEFGASVPAEQQARDRADVAAYAARLRRITGHPIGMSEASPNFHVLFMGLDDKAQTVARIQEIVPNINPKALGIFQNLPRSIHCLVIAFAGTDNSYGYSRAIALVRSEHPPLLRRSCIHEELAQGLGLANDSPRARPSIFNDDDEFALLTTHDEMLLRMLYDPRLRPGMSLTEARPYYLDTAQQLLGGGS